MALSKGGLKELALFAGAGGGILGGHLLGWRTVCAVEIEDYPRRVLLQRQADGILPRFPIWDDICTFDGKPWRGKVDVISGGFPCQDVSCAGKGAGIEGEQSGLWREMARVIGEAQPRHVFGENSPMLLGRGFEKVCMDLEAVGYRVSEPVILGADVFGACHRRKRLWFYATNAERDEQSREEPCSGEAGRMGRVIQSVPWHEPWESALSRLRGVDAGLARTVDRTDCIRNGQIPAVAALAWQILSGD